MKLELLVIPDQHAGVNTFPGLVHTARHTTKVGNTRSRWPNRKEGAVEGGVGDWGEVVTRWPYRKVRPDHLLSKECFPSRSSVPLMRLGHTCWCTVVSVKRLMWLRLASCSTRMIDVVFSSVLRE
jgi:hypothetical protein